jgi:thioredoxin-like negative regulator of GroEL
MMIGAPTSVRAGGDWNDSGIKWKSFDEGVAEAAKEKKPICLVLYTEWCPHCTNYSAVFHDAKVVEQSKNFVMIRVDKDKNPEISKKYAPDGEYIPRTYFLSPDGKLDPEIHAPRDQFKYFYDERVPGSVLGGMEEALKKLKPKETKA